MLTSHFILLSKGLSPIITVNAYFSLYPSFKGSVPDNHKGFTHEELEIVERLEGKMPITKAIRCRASVPKPGRRIVRYFTDGAVFGAADYVEREFTNNRSQFGAKRENGARYMRGADWGGSPAEALA